MARTRSDAPTAIEKKVLDFVQQAHEAGLGTPPLREICAHCNWTSVATASEVLHRLRRRNLFFRRKRPHRPRSKPSPSPLETP